MSGPDSSPVSASTPPTTQPPPRTTRHHTPTLADSRHGDTQCYN